MNVVFLCLLHCFVLLVVALVFARYYMIVRLHLHLLLDTIFSRLPFYSVLLE